MSSVHERDLDEAEAGSLPKRLKVEPVAASDDSPAAEGTSTRTSTIGHHLPPSHVLLSCERSPGILPQFSEVDVGISEYVSRHIPKVEGIIKQRFTDFLVFEVDLKGQVVHIQSLGMPGPSIKETESKEEVVEEPWSERFDTQLQPFLSPNIILELKKLYLDGPEHREADGQKDREVDKRKVLSEPIQSKATRAAFHHVVRELFGGKLNSETDVSSPSPDGGSRIAITWFGRGKSTGKDRRTRGRDNRTPRNHHPPYIHFSLQKTNRDTQDALLHLSRLLRINVKDLSVAGTKDKRGVTVQKVSLKRGSKTLEEVWKLANGIGGRRSIDGALRYRGERGVRTADFEYQENSLELGMLEGNAFVITLRNVKVDSMQDLDLAMNTLKHKGFINYYGMQRFGTAAVPTHSIGLAILQSDWHKAISLILQTRPGEHPDVMAAREAWLVEGDLDKALQLMPRRVVAERCILENYRKQNGETRNAMGALSTVPRNLRLMYVHAYQSYIWNAIVSERIRTWGCETPIVGDLVYDVNPEVSVEESCIEPLDDEMDEDVGEAIPNPSTSTSTSQSRRPQKRTRKPWVAPRVKRLTESDLDKYTIFDVVMPLPGKDVTYPGSQLGEKYMEFLRLDGLDPNNFERKQKDYSLSGSYRKIMHLPKELSWSILHYTDPDVALAQADEDKLLGFDAPSITDDGKFVALQISITLGTAAYATMALREVTKTDTGSQYQTALTRDSEDQEYKGAQMRTLEM